MDIQKLEALVDRLYSEWCLGQAKYLNVAVIKADLKAVIIEHITSPEWKDRPVDDDGYDEALGELVSEVQDILVILQPEYVGDGRQLDRRIGEMDLEIEDILKEYLD